MTFRSAVNDKRRASHRIVEEYLAIDHDDPDRRPVPDRVLREIERLAGGVAAEVLFFDRMDSACLTTAQNRI
jgi:hypothetical protein